MHGAATIFEALPADLAAAIDTSEFAEAGPELAAEQELLSTALGAYVVAYRQGAVPRDRHAVQLCASVEPAQLGAGVLALLRRREQEHGVVFVAYRRPVQLRAQVPDRSPRA